MKQIYLFLGAVLLLVGFSSKASGYGNGRRVAFKKSSAAVQIKEGLFGSTDSTGVSGKQSTKGKLKDRLRNGRDGAVTRSFPGRALLRLALTPDEAGQHVASGANMILITHDVQLIKAMYAKLIRDMNSTIELVRKK